MAEIDVFIKQHEILIGSIAKKFDNVKYYDMDDKINIGRVICWKCYKRYKNDKGTKFTTYLTESIINNYKGLATGVNLQKNKIFKSIDYRGLNFTDKYAGPDYNHRADSIGAKEMSIDIDKIFKGKQKDIVILLWQGYTKHAVYGKLRRRYYRNKGFRLGRNIFDKDITCIRNKLSSYFGRKGE